MPVFIYFVVVVTSLFLITSVINVISKLCGWQMPLAITWIQINNSRFLFGSVVVEFRGVGDASLVTGRRKHSSFFSVTWISVPVFLLFIHTQSVTQQSSCSLSYTHEPFTVIHSHIHPFLFTLSPTPMHFSVTFIFSNSRSFINSLSRPSAFTGTYIIFRIGRHIIFSISSLVQVTFWELYFHE